MCAYVRACGVVICFFLPVCVCVCVCVCVSVCVGSLVPFSLRLLHAQLPLWTADPSLSLAVDRVYSIKSTVSKVFTQISQIPLTEN